MSRPHRDPFYPQRNEGVGIWLASIIGWGVVTAICVYLVVTQGGIS